MFSKGVTAASPREALQTAKIIGFDRFLADTGKVADGWYVILWNKSKRESDVWWFNAAGEEVEQPVDAI